MIIQCFSSEDFGPKRLIYSSDTPAVWTAEASNFDIDPNPSARGKEQKIMDSTQQQTKDLARRVKSSRANPELVQEMTDGLEKGQEGQIIKGIGNYYDKQKNKVYAAREGWRKWNEEYYPKETPEKAKEKVMAMQQALFTRLGILGRPGADIDGKIGPFTLLAMAAIAGRKRSGVATEAVENNPNHKKVIEMVDATVPEPDATVYYELTNEEKEEKEKEREEKEQKRKKVAKIEGKNEKKEKEIYRQSGKVYRNYAEAAKHKKTIEETYDTKDFHTQQKEAEEKAEDAKGEIDRLKKEKKDLEEESDVVRFGPEYVAKRNLKSVEKEIRDLWKKMRGYRSEEKSLRNEVEANLFQAETNLENKLEQIDLLNNELWEKEQEEIALNAQINTLPENA